MVPSPNVTTNYTSFCGADAARRCLITHLGPFCTPCLNEVEKLHDVPFVSSSGLLMLSGLVLFL